jgi:hypothetical protein
MVLLNQVIQAFRRARLRVSGQRPRRHLHRARPPNGWRTGMRSARDCCSLAGSKSLPLVHHRRVEGAGRRDPQDLRPPHADSLYPVHLQQAPSAQVGRLHLHRSSASHPTPEQHPLSPGHRRPEGGEPTPQGGRLDRNAISVGQRRVRFFEVRPKNTRWPWDLWLKSSPVSPMFPGPPGGEGVRSRWSRSSGKDLDLESVCSVLRVHAEAECSVADLNWRPDESLEPPGHAPGRDLVETLPGCGLDTRLQH